jgi:hypothetical protein
MHRGFDDFPKGTSASLHDSLEVLQRLLSLLHKPTLDDLSRVRIEGYAA